MPIPFKYIKPIIHSFDPETAHKITIFAGKHGLTPRFKNIDNPKLKTTVLGNEFSNPIGLAAGFDKNAEMVSAVHHMGFGFAEFGGVTINPQKGLPKPRIFRDTENEAIINRMNFPNVGMVQFKKNMADFRQKNPDTNKLVGIQIAMTSGQTEPEKDFKKLMRELGSLADYMVFNVSCPNAPGLKNLEQADVFHELALTLINERNSLYDKKQLPLCVKFSPDLNEDQQQALAKACLDTGIDGLILSNTTTKRPDYLPQDFRERLGGLSGKPLNEKSTSTIHNFYQYTNGQIPIIGVGGVSNANDAYEKIKAGASLIQLYSALVFHGPELITQICRDLAMLLDQDGFNNISDAVGTAHT